MARVESDITKDEQFEIYEHVGWKVTLQRMNSLKFLIMFIFKMGACETKNPE